MAIYKGSTKISGVEIVDNIDDENVSTETTYSSSKIDEELDKKQDMLTFDTTPTSGSANPVTSGGLYTKFSTYSNVESFSQDLTFTSASGNHNILGINSLVYFGIKATKSDGSGFYYGDICCASMSMNTSASYTNVIDGTVSGLPHGTGYTYTWRNRSTFGDWTNHVGFFGKNNMSTTNGTFQIYSAISASSTQMFQAEGWMSPIPLLITFTA